MNFHYLPYPGNKFDNKTVYFESDFNRDIYLLALGSLVLFITMFIKQKKNL